MQRTKNLDGTTLSLEDAERECFLLTVGGQDTSPAFICAFVDYILRTPGIYSKLSEEIRDHEQHNKLSNPVVKFEETSKLPYFMACVQETLRLSPSASLLLPRYAPKGGISLGGYWVPEHTEIAANPYVIHRNKHVFGEDAKDFRPERWLEDPSRARQMNKYQFAFGYGSRKCLGKNIAMFTSQKFCLQVSMRQSTVRSSIANVCNASFSEISTCSTLIASSLSGLRIGVSMFTSSSISLSSHVDSDPS